MAGHVVVGGFGPPPNPFDIDHENERTLQEALAASLGVPAPAAAPRPPAPPNLIAPGGAAYMLAPPPPPPEAPIPQVNGGGNVAVPPPVATPVAAQGTAWFDDWALGALVLGLLAGGVGTYFLAPHDWTETRRWCWVGGVAAASGLVLFAARHLCGDGPTATPQARPAQATSAYPEPIPYSLDHPHYIPPPRPVEPARPAAPPIRAVNDPRPGPAENYTMALHLAPVAHSLVSFHNGGSERQARLCRLDGQRLEITVESLLHPTQLHRLQGLELIERQMQDLERRSPHPLRAGDRSLENLRQVQATILGLPTLPPVFTPRAGLPANTDLVFFVNHRGHWVSVVIDPQARRICCYDSKGTALEGWLGVALRNIADWLEYPHDNILLPFQPPAAPAPAAGPAAPPARAAGAAPTVLQFDDFQSGVWALWAVERHLFEERPITWAEANELRGDRIANIRDIYRRHYIPDNRDSPRYDPQQQRDQFSITLFPPPAPAAPPANPPAPAAVAAVAVPVAAAGPAANLLPVPPQAVAAPGGPAPGGPAAGAPANAAPAAANPIGGAP